MSKQVPEGMMEDAQQRLVPIENIKQIDLERDALVKEIVAKADKLADEIYNFKNNALGDIAAFVDLSAEKYGANIGGKKGNISLLTFDGRYKIVRAIDERQVFDERLQAAKALIDECITEWAQGANANLHTLITDAFQVDKLGRLNINRILGLRRLNIDDDRWKHAMAAISESLQVIDTKTYIRIYERQENGSYEPMPLNVAA